MLRGKWSREGTRFVAELRVGGHGEDHIGEMVTLASKDGTFTTVWLTKLVRDYGVGDVATFEISREMPSNKPSDGLPVDERGRTLPK